jgi:phosphoglycolate phosphatase-like HAD superfamily hydrolase
MKLLIFDIDGTLTHLDGATRRAFKAAFRKVFDVDAVTTELKLHGRTDPIIFLDCFHTTGLSGDWQESFARFRDAYVEALPVAIAATQNIGLHPGIPELLDELTSRQSQVALALGTGNMEAGARTKIGFFDLNRYFPVGGFGDIHCERRDIMRDALINAENYYGLKFNLQDVWVIGDTPHDIAGGKAIRARTMGVATGGAYSYDELVATDADVVFHDLSDTARVLEALELR